MHCNMNQKGENSLFDLQPNENFVINSNDDNCVFAYSQWTGADIKCISQYTKSGDPAYNSKLRIGQLNNNLAAVNIMSENEQKCLVNSDGVIILKNSMNCAQFKVNELNKNKLVLNNDIECGLVDEQLVCGNGTTVTTGLKLCKWNNNQMICNTAPHAGMDGTVSDEMAGSASAGMAGSASAGMAGSASAGMAGPASPGMAGSASAGMAGPASAGMAGSASAGMAGPASAGSALSADSVYPPVVMTCDKSNNPPNNATSYDCKQSSEDLLLPQSVTCSASQLPA